MGNIFTMALEVIRYFSNIFFDLVGVVPPQDLSSRGNMIRMLQPIFIVTILVAMSARAVIEFVNEVCDSSMSTVRCRNVEQVLENLGFLFIYLWLLYGRKLGEKIRYSVDNQVHRWQECLHQTNNKLNVQILVSYGILLSTKVIVEAMFIGAAIFSNGFPLDVLFKVRRLLLSPIVFAVHSNMTLGYLLELQSSYFVGSFFIESVSHFQSDIEEGNTDPPQEIRRLRRRSLVARNGREAFLLNVQTRNLNLLQNRYIHPPLSFYLVLRAFYTGFFLLSYQHWRNSMPPFIAVSVGVLAALRTLLYVSITVGLTLNCWRRYRRNALQVGLTKVIYTTGNPRVIKLLDRYVGSVNDPYPDTPCVLCQLDPSLVNIIVDCFALVATTLTCVGRV